MKYLKYENAWKWGRDIQFIAEDGKSTVSVGYYYNDWGLDCFINNLRVHKSIRKKGRGQELLELAEKTILQSETRRAYLYVTKRNWVSRWYERNGYSFTGEIDKDCGYEMSKNLPK